RGTVRLLRSLNPSHTRTKSSCSRLGRCSVSSRSGVLCGVDKLTNFSALFLQLREVLLADFLVDLKLLLSALFFPGVYVGLAQTIVRVGQVAIQFQRPLIFRNGFAVFPLVGVKIAELQMRFGQRRIERNGLLQQRGD